MMNAYNKSYLEDAMHNLGAMADYAVNCIGIYETEFWSRFTTSTVAARFSVGAPDIIAGHSGPELAIMVMQETGKGIEECNCSISISSPQYWAGWILAYYQWLRGYSFRELAQAGLDLKTVIDMFNPMHEADPSTFANLADRKINEKESPNWIKEFRKMNRLTQEELSEKSGVPIRLIRAYEQGTIDTNRAEYHTIKQLERSLNLSIPV